MANLSRSPFPSPPTTLTLPIVRSIESQIPHLPPELIELILRKTNAKTLVRCRLVCRTWRIIVDRLLREEDLWKIFCLSDFPDAWRSVSEKGTLSWSDIYLNICLWAKLNSAYVKSELLKNLTNLDKNIVTANISREGFLNVTLRNSIKLYDIVTLKPIQEIAGQYFCFFENEHVQMVHSDNHTLYLKPNYYNSRTTQENLMIDNVYLFRVIDDICYYITLKQELCTFNFSNSEKKLLIKWYNSDAIFALDHHKNNTYLLTKSGKILIYQLNRLIVLRYVKWPNTSNLYKKFYLFRGNIFFYCDYSTFHVSLADNKEMTYTDLFVSCILLHGNVLIIGTYFGLVSLYLIKKSEDLLNLSNIPPISSHLLCVDCPISGIDIFEEKSTHTIFAWTASNIFMIKYDHSSNCIEKLLCNGFAVCSLIQCSDTNTDYSLNQNSTETV